MVGVNVCFVCVDKMVGAPPPAAGKRHVCGEGVSAQAASCATPPKACAQEQRHTARALAPNTFTLHKGVGVVGGEGAGAQGRGEQEPGGVFPRAPDACTPPPRAGPLSSPATRGWIW